MSLCVCTQVKKIECKLYVENVGRTSSVKRCIIKLLSIFYSGVAVSRSSNRASNAHLYFSTQVLSTKSLLETHCVLKQNTIQVGVSQTENYNQVGFLRKCNPENQGKIYL